MKAYCVHDARKAADMIVIPERDLCVPVDREAMEGFIGVQPAFATWRGMAAGGLPPESFGRLVATREDPGDVCIVDAGEWQALMQRHLGRP